MSKKKITILITFCLILILTLAAIFYFRPEKGTFYNLKVYDKISNKSFTSLDYSGKQLDLKNDTLQRCFNYLNEFQLKELSKKDLQNFSPSQHFTLLDKNADNILRIFILKDKDLKSTGISILLDEQYKKNIFRQYSLDKPIDIKKLETILGF